MCQRAKPRCDYKKQISIESLECLRNTYSIIFIRAHVHNSIKCSSLLGLLNFFSPQRPLREYFHFRLPHSRSILSNKCWVSHCIIITNKVLKYIDLFVNGSAASFKNELLYVLNYKLWINFLPFSFKLYLKFSVIYNCIGVVNKYIYFFLEQHLLLWSVIRTINNIYKILRF